MVRWTRSSPRCWTRCGATTVRGWSSCCTRTCTGRRPASRSAAAPSFSPTWRPSRRRPRRRRTNCATGRSTAGPPEPPAQAPSGGVGILDRGRGEQLQLPAFGVHVLLLLQVRRHPHPQSQLARGADVLHHVVDAGQVVGGDQLGGGFFGHGGLDIGHGAPRYCPV